MDLDAFTAAHVQTWRRLEELGARPPQSGAESDELVDLYQEVATHLSLVRSSAPDADVIAYLSAILAKSRTRALGTRAATARTFVEFFTHRFPAALYLSRRWWLTTMLVSYALTGLAMWWLLRTPQVEQSMMSPEQVDQLINNDFASYYSESAASSFALQVWTNNVWACAVCLAFGVLGLPVIYILFQNLANVAIIGSIMIRHDRGDLFFGLITPHGLLELTAVFVAAGIGLRTFWAWVSPGEVTRVKSLAAQGRAAGAVVLGLIVVLGISGVIEAFVTPSGLPTWARIGIGAVAEVLFLGYVFVVGRRAARMGHTGDLDASLLEDAVATAR